MRIYINDHLRALCLSLAVCCASVVSISGQELSDIDKGLAALDADKTADAVLLFKKAYDEGDPDGAFFLARMLELGIDAPANLNGAISLYIASSAEGSALSMNRLGMLHLRGEGVLQDYRRGAVLVCAAADLGDVNGAFNCGRVLENGLGVQADAARSQNYFAKAASLGHLAAMNTHAVALLEGRGVERDPEAAVKLFSRSADQGSAAGLYGLGHVHALGEGVEKDLIKAHSFFNLAATLGHPVAAQQRAALEQQMSPGDVLAAQELATQWRPQTNPKMNEITQVDEATDSGLPVEHTE